MDIQIAIDILIRLIGYQILLGICYSLNLHAVRIRACPMKVFFNEYEQSNTRGDILNAGDNVDDQEFFGFTESFFKFPPTNMNEYTIINN